MTNSFEFNYEYEARCLNTNHGLAAKFKRKGITMFNELYDFDSWNFVIITISHEASTEEEITAGNFICEDGSQGVALEVIITVKVKGILDVSTIRIGPDWTLKEHLAIQQDYTVLIKCCKCDVNQ